ncbi:FAD-dependent oxidoreductase [Spirosoma utsteinense]|uniref:2-polyprenyl-6-methoxyphenol hydroxylase-like FAD-dependent oxidoreductase n=1 Tax=Spirosoma utsteinense TaxID=2585773 RepID=A0ABR6WEL4_9BACT|nr:FAD-dependent monooxygenase [Spirosoma utsteinense]MBC3788670.1 2-polyprenyl-6-methoxyphenol hydroxylase-like FAD-dependent oxidoreductase [Spirosoma utsteinense]MBC3794638.1 2-polyprenyl-6-methoxyphenol hydroxylase-like FAD-dependent oxidoreductase [Spirosoma utsteinense]
MSQDSLNFDTDVIIVGAGPIGMTTACALQHHGVRCRIFEERKEPKEYSRANNVWARTQELLASIGLRDVLAEQAYQIEKQTVFLDGQPLDQVKLDEVDSPYPKVLYSGQDVIEKTLSEQIARRGGSVERDRKVVSIEQDDEGIYVTVVTASDEQANAKPQRLRCRYVVGADGYEGTIRKAVGLDFETEKI